MPHTGVVSLFWMVLRAAGWIPGIPRAAEILVIVIIWTMLFAALSLVGLVSTRD